MRGGRLFVIPQPVSVGACCLRILDWLVVLPHGCRSWGGRACWSCPQGADSAGSAVPNFALLFLSGNGDDCLVCCRATTELHTRRL